MKNKVQVIPIERIRILNIATLIYQKILNDGCQVMIVGTGKSLRPDRLNLTKVTFKQTKSGGSAPNVTSKNHKSSERQKALFFRSHE